MIRETKKTIAAIFKGNRKSSVAVDTGCFVDSGIVKLVDTNNGLYCRFPVGVAAKTETGFYDVEVLVKEGMMLALKYQVSTDDYPAFPDAGKVETIGKGVFRLEEVYGIENFIDPTHTRAGLRCVHFAGGMVEATDGRVLFQTKTNINPELSFLLPVKALQVIRASQDISTGMGLEFSIIKGGDNAEYIHYRLDGGDVFLKLSGAEYSNTAEAIPDASRRKNMKKVSFPATVLYDSLAALETVVNRSDERYKMIIVNGNSIYAAKAGKKVVLPFALTEPDYFIGFNRDYLETVIEQFRSEQVDMLFGSVLSASLILATAKTGLIMPLRIDNEILEHDISELSSRIAQAEIISVTRTEPIRKAKAAAANSEMAKILNDLEVARKEINELRLEKQRLEAVVADLEVTFGHKRVISSAQVSYLKRKRPDLSYEKIRSLTYHEASAIIRETYEARNKAMREKLEKELQVQA